VKKAERRRLAQLVVADFVSRTDGLEFDNETTNGLKDKPFDAILAEIRKANVVLVWGRK